MKQTELRIGNYIRYRDDYDCVVYSLGQDFATDQRHLNPSKKGYCTGSDDLEEYEPIAITEQYLFRLGFELDREYGGYVDKNHKIILEDGFCTLIPFCTNDIDCYTTVYSVHQVQNLCFALTGEELTVKSISI